MPITYPLSIPNYSEIVRARFTARNVVGVTQSPFTGQTQVYQHAGAWWEVDFALAPMARARAEEWAAWLLQLGGSYGTFLLGDPAGQTPRGAAVADPTGGGETNNPRVWGAGQSGQYLLTHYWLASTTNQLMAGDWIQIGAGSTARLHRVLENASSDINGRTTLTLWPALRESPAADAKITIRNTQGVFRLAHSAVPYDVTGPQIYQVAFSATEVV